MELGHVIGHETQQPVLFPVTSHSSAFRVFACSGTVNLWVVLQENSNFSSTCFRASSASFGIQNATLLTSDPGVWLLCQHR